MIPRVSGIFIVGYMALICLFNDIKWYSVVSDGVKWYSMIFNVISRSTRDLYRCIKGIDLLLRALQAVRQARPRNFDHWKRVGPPRVKGPPI